MKARKVLAILSAVLLAFVGIAWLWLRSVESSKRRHLAQRVAELTAELDSRCGPRPVLRGVPVPGNAWDDYFQAIDLLTSMGNPIELMKYAVRAEETDRDEARALVAKYGSAAEGIRKGAQRADARRVRFTDEEHPTRVIGPARLGQGFTLASLTVSRARMLAEEENQPHAAMELLLDLCQFAQDTARDGSKVAELYGSGYYSLALGELKVLLGKLSPEDCRQLERELAQLDATMPSLHPSLLGELERLGSRIANDRLLPELQKGKAIPPESRPGWRHAFSMDLLLHAAFEEADGLVAAWFRDADPLPYPEDMARWRRFCEDCNASRNWLVKYFGSTVSGGSVSLRDRRTHLRLLQTAAHYRATGEILALDDPYGSKLLHRAEVGRMRFWGRGQDCTDDAADGDWAPFSSKDIVLTIPGRP